MLKRNFFNKTKNKKGSLSQNSASLKRSFWHQFGPQNVFLEVIALLDVRYCPKLQSCAISRKNNDASLRKQQKTPNFWPNLGPLKLFSWVLPLLVYRQCSKLSSYAIFRKTNDPNLKNDKKANFGPNFGPFGPNLGHQIFFLRVLHLLVVRNCSKLSFYAI